MARVTHTPMRKRSSYYYYPGTLLTGLAQVSCSLVFEVNGMAHSRISRKCIEVSTCSFGDLERVAVHDEHPSLKRILTLNIQMQGKCFSGLASPSSSSGS